MQDSNGSENGNGNPNGDGHGNSLLEGELIEVCGVQRGNEPYPCTNAEPCDLHCGAKTRGERGGRRCSNYAMPNGRCRMHSGHANRGIGHHNYKDGRTSRYAPRGIKDAYERALAEGIRTTENREELALITASIERVLGEIGEDSEDWFRILNEHADRIEAFRASEGHTTMLAEVLELIKSIRRGSQKYHKRRELMSWIDLRRKTSSAETRRLEKEQQMVSREEVLMLMDQMGQIIYEEVEDRKVRARIAERVAQLTA